MSDQKPVLKTPHLNFKILDEREINLVNQLLVLLKGYLGL